MWEIFFVLRQTIFQSQANDFPFCAKCFSILCAVVSRFGADGFGTFR